MKKAPGATGRLLRVWVRLLGDMPALLGALKPTGLCSPFWPPGRHLLWWWGSQKPQT